jgi:organic radical activating enzyme
LCDSYCTLIGACAVDRQRHFRDRVEVGYERLAFDSFLLQPMDGPHREEYTRAAVEYCLANPQWRLSLRTHNVLGID